MSKCVCGHTRNEEKNCDGTHKVVKAVREQIATEIESLPLVHNHSQQNALGIRMLAAQIARGQK